MTAQSTSQGSGGCLQVTCLVSQSALRKASCSKPSITTARSQSASTPSMIYVLLSLSLLRSEYGFVYVSTVRMPCGQLHNLDSKRSTSIETTELDNMTDLTLQPPPRASQPECIVRDCLGSRQMQVTVITPRIRDGHQVYLAQQSRTIEGSSLGERTVCNAVIKIPYKPFSEQPKTILHCVSRHCLAGIRNW